MSSITTDQGIVHYEVYGRASCHPVAWISRVMGVIAADGLSWCILSNLRWIFGALASLVPSAKPMPCRILSAWLINSWNSSELPAHRWWDTAWVEPLAWLSPSNIPERVSKVVIIGSPIVGSSLFFFPRVFGYRTFGWLTYHNIWVYKSFYHLLASAYSKDRNWATMMDRDVSRTTMQAFFASIGSLRKTDLRPSLGQIRVQYWGCSATRISLSIPINGSLCKRGCRRAR